MKKIFLALCLFVFSDSFAQNQEEAKEIIQSQTFTLAGLSGKSRQIIPITLPQKTIKWFYAFSAFRNKEDVQKYSSAFSLFSKLSLLLDQTGTTAGAISLIGKPPGNDNCDVYLLNSFLDINPFESKAELNPFDSKSWNYNRQGSREGLVSGTIDIINSNKIASTQYLAFRNKSIYSVNVTIQVVAIVEKEIKINGWTKEQKNKMFNVFKTNFNSNGISNMMSNDQMDKLIGCILKKCTNSYTPEYLNTLAEYELSEILKNMGSQCEKELSLQITDKPLPGANTIKEKIVGKWKDENSNFTLYADSVIYMNWKNGKSAWGIWTIENGLFKIKYSKFNINEEYYILEFSETKFKYQLTDKIKDDTIYNAEKISSNPNK